MRFVDRKDEAARLKDALAREKSSLVVICSRRRLGKSTLIKKRNSQNVMTPEDIINLSSVTV